MLIEVEPQKNLNEEILFIDARIRDEEDEDFNGRTQNRNGKSVIEKAFHSTGTLVIHQNQTFESRCFWKAGDYVVVSSKSAPPEGHLEHARVHPKFLHSNATSHKWAFGAVAELLDNAVDEISNGATFVKVDVIFTTKNKDPTLLFHDDGGGMDPDCMRQCMSLGYSSKKGSTTIGQYGNGFKTSTMRLGADVIVFSRAIRGSRVTQSVGLLSYTFLRSTGQDDVIVPMVDFEISGNRAYPIIYSSQDDWSNNLKLIAEWSPFASQNELLQQFDDIGARGTKNIIYNLWLDDKGVLELDLDFDEEDIRLGDEFKHGKLQKEHKLHNKLLESHISYQMRFSLRAYVSILYLRKFTNFRIILRGKPVQQYSIAEDLNLSEVVMYRPKLGLGKTSEEVLLETTIGFVKEAPNLGVSGFNVYHKNRLIRPFWKVTAGGASKGRCAVGILEANFIEPAHDKQDFERSSLFIRLEAWLKKSITDYWSKNCHLVGFWSPIPEIRNVQMETRDDRPVTRAKHSSWKERPTEKHIIGLSDTSEEEEGEEEGTYCNQSLVGFPSSNMQQSSNIAQSSNGGEDPRNGLCSKLTHQICEENIQLKIRSEAHKQKKTALKNKIEELKEDLQDYKRKCFELSTHIANRKKQLLAQHGKGKF